MSPLRVLASVMQALIGNIHSLGEPCRGQAILLCTYICGKDMLPMAALISDGAVYASGSTHERFLPLRLVFRWPVILEGHCCLRLCCLIDQLQAYDILPLAQALVGCLSSTTARTISSHVWTPRLSESLHHHRGCFGSVRHRLRQLARHPWSYLRVRLLRQAINSLIHLDGCYASRQLLVPQISVSGRLDNQKIHRQRVSRHSPSVHRHHIWSFKSSETLDMPLHHQNARHSTGFCMCSMW